MRLAERLGVSLHKLLSDYHRKELKLWLAWTRKEPTYNQRIEYAIGRLCAIQTSTKTKKTKPEDYIFKSNWTPKSDIKSDVDWIRSSLSKK